MQPPLKKGEFSTEWSLSWQDGKQRGKYISQSHSKSTFCLKIQFNSKPLFAVVGLLESSVSFSTAWHITGTEGRTVWMFLVPVKMSPPLSFHIQHKS